MGSVLGYDALCRSSDSHSPHNTSRHSTPEHIHKKIDIGIINYFLTLMVIKYFKMDFQMIVLQ